MNLKSLEKFLVPVTMVEVGLWHVAVSLQELGRMTHSVGNIAGLACHYFFAKKVEGETKSLGSGSDTIYMLT